MPEFKSDFDQDLKAALQEKSTPVYMTQKAELVDYYQQRQANGEIKSWKQAIIADLQALYPDLKYKTAEKRFDAQRRYNTEPKNAAQYAALGRELGVIVDYKAPAGGFSVQWLATIHISKNGYDRSHTNDFTGDAAQDLLDHAQWSTVMDAYFAESGQESPVVDIDMLDYVGVEAMEE